MTFLSLAIALMCPIEHARLFSLSLTDLPSYLEQKIKMEYCLMCS